MQTSRRSLMLALAGGIVLGQMFGPAVDQAIETYRNGPNDPDTGELVTGGAALLKAEITLAGYYNWIDTGKLPYGTPDTGAEYENGGISGVIRYATTRNEFDPRLAAADRTPR